MHAADITLYTVEIPVAATAYARQLLLIGGGGGVRRFFPWPEPTSPDHTQGREKKAAGPRACNAFPQTARLLLVIVLKKDELNTMNSAARDPHRPFMLLSLCSIVFLMLFAVGVQPTFAQKKSTSKDINKPFRDPDVNRFVNMFEHEGRSIYDKREEILKAIAIKPGMTIADIGAGTGLYSRLFAKSVGPQGRVYAVDIAKKFVDHTIETCRQQKLDNVVGVVCTDKSVELPPDSIDAAFICDTYHHFEYPQETMQSIFKALRADGNLYVIDFERILGKSPEWIIHHVRGSKEVFTKEIESAGFEKVEEFHILKDNYFLKFRKKPVVSSES